jgi:thimet oligopeptidase
MTLLKSRWSRFILTVPILGALACANAAQRPETRSAMAEPPVGAAAKLVSGKPDDLLASCRKSLDDARAEVARLKGMPAPRKTSDALEAYDQAMAALGDASARADVARNASPDAAMRKAGEDADQEIQKLATELSLDRALYDALSGVDLSSQDESTKYWIGRELREFRRAGVDRDEATRSRVKQLNEELVLLGQKFNRNVREDVRKVKLDPKDLDGLPKDYVDSHLPGDDGKVTITTDYPDFFPFLSYAKNGKAREAVWRAFNTRAHPQNLDVLGQLLAKRHELATLLGYPTWAAYATENKMIGTAKAAHEFIDRIAKAADQRSKGDLATLLERKRKDQPGAERVEAWDTGYLSDRVQAEQYAFDAQAVRPYFEFARTLQGVLDVTGKLLGVQYQHVTDATVWHPDVHVYDVVEGGKRLGRIYLDLHPREGKYKHAAQFTLVSGREGRRLPEGVLMCNFPKPGPTPALMEHGDVSTLFHEFGHLVHHVLGGHTKWAGQSGVRTEWDFVEAPSQLLEEWVRDATVLASFARHHQTGEPIPADLVQRMRAAEEFGKGMKVRRQMFLAALSLDLHDRDPKGLDTTRVVAETMDRYSPIPYVPGTFMQTSFGHLESYSAAYYTYMWSLVIAKDLFTEFEKKGLFDAGSARRYRRSILEPGGGKPAAKLVEEFLGRPYDFRAYEAWLNRG